MSDHPAEGGRPVDSGWTALACAAILIAGVAAWSNSFNGPFIFDDLGAIRDNPTIRHFPAWANFVPPYPNPISRRPVVNFTLALNYALSGPGVRGFHAGNLLIHLLTALVLFGIVRRTLLQCRLPNAECRMIKEKEKSTANGFDQDPFSVHSAVIPQHSAIGNRQSAIACWLAFCAALIWAVHPLLTESVTYLTQRTELLMGLFFLLTLYCAIRGFTTPGTKELRMANGQLPIANSQLPIRNFPFAIAFSRRFWFVAAIAACALGMGSKEVMATAPIVVLVYDRCFLSGSFREALRRRLPFYLGLAATWTILGALLIAYPGSEAAGSGFGLAEAGPWEYARTQPGVILNYLRLSFWPSPLCLDYSWPIATSARQIIPTAAVVAALLAATLWALRRVAAIGFFGAWFFLILAPSSSFVPIVTEVAAERRMYLPLAAVVTACVVAAWRLGGKLLRRAAGSPETQKLLGRAAATAVLSVAGALGWLTFDRNADYRNAISIWRDAADKRPLNSRAQFNLGASYLEAGRPDEAIRCFSKAIELNPDFLDAYYNRGLAFTRINRLAEAVRDYNKAIELKPAYANAYNSRAAVALSGGRYNEALADCDKAIALRPDYADAYVNRGNIYAVARRYTEALRDYDQAITFNPDDADAWLNRGTACADAGRPEEALRDLNKAISLSPDYATAYVNRGNIYAVARRYAEALRDYDQAIALKPDYARAYLNRAIAYYTMKDYPRALSDMRSAQRLGERPPPDLLRALTEAAGRSEPPLSPAP